MRSSCTVRLAVREGIRSSVTSSDCGCIGAGYRQPWVETEPGPDNFAPLPSLTWQVHVYGQLQPGLAETCAELQLPLHRFLWRTATERAGFARSAVYLVRPDGYVALADPHGDSERLRAYWRAGDMEKRNAAVALSENGSEG